MQQKPHNLIDAVYTAWSRDKEAIDVVCIRERNNPKKTRGTAFFGAKNPFSTDSRGVNLRLPPKKMLGRHVFEGPFFAVDLLGTVFC